MAALDWEVRELRRRLAEFEAGYRARLAGPEDRQRRLTLVLGHLERWIALLERGPEPGFGARMRAAEDRQDRQARTVRRPRAAPPAPDAPHPGDVPAAPAEAGLKDAFRQLVKRYHPDLARTEDEALRLGARLREVTALYRAGDLAGLEALIARAAAEEGPAAEPPDPAEALALLADRLARVESRVSNLGEEQRDLLASDIGRLEGRAEAAGRDGRDLVAEIAGRLAEQLADRVGELPWAFHRLEDAVRRFTTRPARSRGLAPAEPGNGSALERFDPLAPAPLVRLGLDVTDLGPRSRAAEREVAWLGSLADAAPAHLDLVLLTHACSASAFPLPGLETYDAVQQRYQALVTDHDPAVTLEDALVSLCDVVEFGPRRASAHLVHLGLRFRSEAVAEAVPAALQSLPVRHAFRRVLAVLGPARTCPTCAAERFAVALFRTRGLDDLRANVCPACATVIDRYYMARGDDVPAVFHRAAIDLGLLTEWTFRLGRATVATELLPLEVDALTAGQLKARLHEDLLTRYDLGIPRRSVHLVQNGHRVADRTPLATLGSQRFDLTLDEQAGCTDAEALDRLRHRIRNRFR
jgi:hypothetical protein